MIVLGFRLVVVVVLLLVVMVVAVLVVVGLMLVLVLLLVLVLVLVLVLAPVLLLLPLSQPSPMPLAPRHPAWGSSLAGWRVHKAQAANHNGPHPPTGVHCGTGIGRAPHILAAAAGALRVPYECWCWCW